MIELDLVESPDPKIASLWSATPVHAWASEVVSLVSQSFEVEGEVALMLSDDTHLKSLNDQFRNKDKATNVLSFPDDEPERLGDIAIAWETLQREAEQQNKPFSDHFRHLALHGILHLMGYDHELEHEAEEMEQLEIELLDALSIPDPYLYLD